MPKVDKKSVGQREETSFYKLINRLNVDRKVSWTDQVQKIFLRELNNLINYWEGQFHHLREVLSRNEIERILLYSVTYTAYHRFNSSEISNLRERLIKLVIESGYKDEPILGEDGKPLLNRDTPLLRAARNYHENCVRLLFKMYDRFDVNYTDEYGYTHFHAACRYGCVEAVQKFLELGQDPNLLLGKTDGDEEETYAGIKELGCRPLHLALYNKYRTKEVMELLLRNGADPNMKIEKGDDYKNAPLHLICKLQDVELMDAFFKINDELKQEVKVDQENRDGFTPLQVAIFDYQADMVEYLLKNRKADASKVGRPYEMGGWCDMNESCRDEFDCASSGLAIIDMLEKYGCKINRSVGQELAEDLSMNGVIEKSAELAENWYDCEDFRREAEKIMVKPGLSLYRLVQLPYDEAKELVTYMEFRKFARSDKLNQLPQRYRENCTVHLIKTMSLGFLQRWGLGF